MSRRRNDHEIAAEIAALLDSEEDKARHPDAEARSLLQQAADAGSGGLRLQYLQQAQRAIAKLDPGRHGKLIAQLQAQVLALQGRRGDSHIAHVTPGEIVIPRQLQTPELLAALCVAVQRSGIDPDRLVVGSRRNSMNPRTGQPEFAFGHPDIDGTNTSSTPPDGTQVADIYINRFPYEANLAGHVGIGVNTDHTQGFYPQTHNGVLSGDVPGEVKDDDLSQTHQTLVIPTNEKQDAAAQKYIEQRRNNPGNYNLYTRQCTDFVDGALHAAGVPVPSDTSPSIWDDMIPNLFFPRLRDGSNK